MIRLGRDKKTALVSIVVTAFFAVIKYFIGILSGSIAMIADAVHSFTDVITSIGVLIGLIISSRKPTKTFPYGFHKAENIVSLFLALAIFYAGYEIILTSSEKFGATVITNLPLTIAVALTSLIVTLLLSRYKLKIGKEINSPSLIADGKHTQVDTYASTAVLLGLTGYYLDFPYLDSIAGIFVTLFIFKAGYEILIDAVKVLLDASIGYEDLSRIKEIVSKIYGVRKINSLKARSSGKFMFVEMEIETNLKDLNRAHQLSNKIEAQIKSEIKNVDRAIIHMEPEKKKIVRYSVPCTENNGIGSRISDHFGEAKYFCLFDMQIADNELADMKFIVNPFIELEKRKGLKAAELLVTKKIDKLITRESIAQKSAFYVLEDSYVDFVQTSADTLEEVIEELKVLS